MTPSYSETVCRQLDRQFHTLGLHRPHRIGRYDAGQHITCRATAINGRCEATLSLRIERFVGGGFAGQVYRVQLETIEGDPIQGLTEGALYAMKILIPPSGFAQMFRNLVYAIGFQAPFQLQTNPTAARCGALWQKFFRRGARVRLGSEQAVNDIHVTFIDTQLGSCAELSDWVDGRTWKLEVDEHMDVLRNWAKGLPFKATLLGSPEYRAKKVFMRDLVGLLHDMGGHEFARQYEWSTCKSQPNCLKRRNAGDGPADGLTAVDFRAGLALLPVLPMSPGDFSLIWQGLKRGSAVQFDRGDTRQLQRFMNTHPEEFADMHGEYDELCTCEKLYRDSQPDITHNGLRLLYDRRLWRTLLASALTGWRITNTIDSEAEERLRSHPLVTLLLGVLSLIPFAGRFIRKVCCHQNWRSHYTSLLIRPGYLMRALRGILLEGISDWHRAGRITAERALLLANAPARALVHLALSVLPVGLHRFCTDLQFARDKLSYIFIRPVRLYFDAEMREQWLRDMVGEGLKKNSLNTADADEILGQLSEPFIQKYLKSLAVHVCTMPVTQLVAVIVAVIYVIMNPDLSTGEAWLHALGIFAVFQVVPLSPGSLVRGLYVLYLIIRERNFKDYNIAVFLGFFKYIGYLAFPIQMAYRYPTLARFMAVHWATGAVPIVPVFGEQGALLEHAVFRSFYNWPLTIRRRMQARMQRLAKLPARLWHIAPLAAAAALVLYGIDAAGMRTVGMLPSFDDVWWATALAGLACGAVMSRWCGGMRISRRIISAVVCGIGIGVLHTLCTAAGTDAVSDPAEIAVLCLWRTFTAAIFTPVGTLLSELTRPDPDIQ